MTVFRLDILGFGRVLSEDSFICLSNEWKEKVYVPVIMRVV